MKSFHTLTSKVIPLPLNDIDTDMIIPAQYLTSTSREGYGENLFKRLRESDPKFPLNMPDYKDAKIMVARENFGCGSSREAAVWALLQYGVRVILAETFADIFYNNSVKNGLVLIQLDKNIIEEILERALQVGIEMTVDLEQQKVQINPEESYIFDFDPFRKECILKGYDEMDYLLDFTRSQ